MPTRLTERDIPALLRKAHAVEFRRDVAIIWLDDGQALEFRTDAAGYREAWHYSVQEANLVLMDKEDVPSFPEYVPFVEDEIWSAVKQWVFWTAVITAAFVVVMFLINASIYMDI